MIDIRPEVAERLAGMAEDRGLDVDTFLTELLDEEEDAADLAAARASRDDWEAKGRPVITTEDIRREFAL